MVVTAPPSPVVKTLFPAKLKIDASPNEPIFLELISAPRDSAASSMRICLFCLAIVRISSILHGRPE